MCEYKLESFYDKKTSTLSYLVIDEESSDAILIDPILNYEYSSSTISKESLFKVISRVVERKLNLRSILETHVHADHLTGALELKKIFPKTKIAIGRGITEVQAIFKDVYNAKDWNSDGSQFDLLLDDGNILKAGSIEVRVIATPGHTPACLSYLIGNRVFTGDALFMPDYGTGRCDFPGGSAKELFHSIKNKLYALPDETKFHPGHDYQPGGRGLKFESTIGESKSENIQLKSDTKEDDFINFRTKRDQTLNSPGLLLPSIQFNANGGEHPFADEKGSLFFKIPVKYHEFDIKI